LIHQQLNAYALAATAAGVGVLALTQPTEAKIVYTPAHHGIQRWGRLFLDLNHDGKTDFVIRQFSGCSNTLCTAYLYVSGSQHWKSNLVEGKHGTIASPAYALKRGAEIGMKRPFKGRAMYYAVHSNGTSGTCGGSWVNVKNRYLGLKFSVKGKVHFGWARLSVTCSPKPKFVAVLTGYAYETIPNKPIIAGKTKGPDVITMVDPASLGRLAQGSSGLAAWRQKKRASSTR
jgi:hypothetical protein